MTVLHPVSADNDPDTQRDLTISLVVTLVLIALKAVALGASGSMSALASLTESALDLAAAGVVLFAIRRSVPTPGPSSDSRVAGEAADLVQVGLILASAILVGLMAFVRIFDPHPVSGGYTAVGIIGVSVLVTGGLVIWQGRRTRGEGSSLSKTENLRSLTELGSCLVAMIGVASGALLNAPGLDAAAGLVIAVWLFWGGVSLLRTTLHRISVVADPTQ